MAPPRRVFAALTASALLMLLSLTVLASNAPANRPVDQGGNVIISPSATNNFDQLVVVLMENKNLNEVYGPAPYMTQLADQYSFSQGWSSITNPSHPNYIALLGASTFGVGGDGNHPNLNHPTLVDLIETSGHTWNAIAEGSGSGCSINPQRGEDHFPFLSYTTITGNPARCANLHSGSSADVVTALNAGTNFIWFTPNDGHNMHDNSVSSGDAWIQSWVPGLLTAMAGKKAALILMFDEAYTSPPYIYMAFSGPATKLAYKSTASYSHYSLAKLLEDVWGGGSLGQGDVNAPSPLEFFNAGGPDFTLFANPGTVSFSAGQSATSTVSLTASGGFTGTVDLTAVSVPTGVTTSCVPTSISGTQTSTCTLSGTNAGTYAVTITGTSGALVHTAPVAVTITAAGPTARFAYSPTVPVVNDTQFTAANGVRSGTGTIADPYIISNWFIDGNLYASSQAMLWIEGTSSYVVIENVRISNLLGTNQWEAFQLGHWPATISTQHVTIRHNEVVNAQHAYGIGIREGSSDIHIEANYVQLEANFDWVYGIATDRGVHGITVFGNYVNAHTSGTFHTVGIHLSDYHVTDGRRATGMVAIQNTVVNATAGGIISESSVGTIIGWNLVYMDYPGSKSIAVDYPRGIETEWFSNGTLVIGNVIHTFHWGIQVGSDQGVIASNTISDVDFAIYVLDNAAWPGISTAADTVYDTTYSSVAITPIRLPTGFQGTVVDLGPGIKKTDLTPVLFVTSPAATSATFDWSRTSLNLSAIVGGMVVFDTASTGDAQTSHASWTGTLTNLDVTSLSAAGVSFQLQSAAAVVFDGTGFTPSTTYNVTRTNTGGTSRILSAQSTPLGGLSFTVPSSTPSTYAVSPGSVSDITPPVTTYSASGTGGAGNWYTSAVTVTLSATDDSSGVAVIHFRTNGGAWEIFSGPVTFQADGSHAIDYYSTDYSGNNETLRSVTVRIDGTAPSSSVQLAGTQAGDGSYISTVDVTVTSTDATSGVQLAQYRVDGGAWRSYSAAFPVSGNGTHTVDYYATDVAGNLESAKSLVVRISGSSFGPPVTVLHVAGTAGQNGWYISRVNVTLTATSPSGTGIFTMYSVDGSGWTQYAQTFMMAEGRHTLDYQSWDSAGFVEPKGSTSIDIDLTPPLLDGSPSGLVTTPDVTITWTGSDGASGVARYEVSIDGGPTESVGMTTSLTRRWSDGDHTVRVTAYDAAGNQDAKVISFTVSPASSGVFGVFQTLPLILPAIALCILLFAVAFWRRRLHRNEAEDRGEPEADDLPPEDYDSSEW